MYGHLWLRYKTHSAKTGMIPRGPCPLSFNIYIYTSSFFEEIYAAKAACGHRSHITEAHSGHGDECEIDGLEAKTTQTGEKGNRYVLRSKYAVERYKGGPRSSGKTCMKRVFLLSSTDSQISPLTSSPAAYCIICPTVLYFTPSCSSLTLLCSETHH